MEIQSKQQIDEHKKEIEQELTEMLQETDSDFSLQHIRDVIFNEEDNDDMMKIVVMFDNGGGGAEKEKAPGIATDG